jgi:hypothetical protein
MIMDSTRAQKLIGHYQSGLLSAREVATDLLFELVSAPEVDTRFLSSIESLPDEVELEFHRLLREIQGADYRWIPPLIAAPTAPRPAPTEYSVKLRQICALLHV